MGHQRDEAWLRYGLVRTDGKRIILIGFVAHLYGNEQVTGDDGDSAQDFRIVLLADHPRIAPDSDRQPVSRRVIFGLVAGRGG
jgi:hypothetical protein